MGLSAIHETVAQFSLPLEYYRFAAPQRVRVFNQATEKAI